MGRRDKLRRLRIVNGEESPLVHHRGKVVNAVVSMLQNLSTSGQVRHLADMLHSGKLSAGELKKALTGNAPKEMRTGAKQLAKKNKPVTVDALMGGIWKDGGFLKLIAEVGIDEQWFINLAEEECKRWGNG